MHKAKKYLLITALATLATGLSTAGIGQAMGGLDKTQDYFQEQANSYPRETKTFTNIKDVRISSDSQFVEVVENTDATNKDFILSYQDTAHTKVTVSEQAGKLKVTNAIKSGYYGASSLFDRSLVGKPMDSQKILLTVPQGTNLENLSIDVENGGLTIQKIQTQNIQLTNQNSYGFNITVSESRFEKGSISAMDALDIQITDSYLKETTLSTDNGRIEFDKVSLENTAIVTETGAIVGKIPQVKGNISIKNDAGVVALTFAQDLQKTTTFQLSNVDGKTSVNEKTVDADYTSQAESPRDHVHIDSYSGSIRLSFEK